MLFRRAVHLCSPEFTHGIFANQAFCAAKNQVGKLNRKRSDGKNKPRTCTSKGTITGAVMPCASSLRVRRREAGKGFSPACVIQELGLLAFQVVCGKEKQETHQGGQVGCREPQATRSCPRWSEWRSSVPSVMRVRSSCEALTIPSLIN